MHSPVRAMGVVASVLMASVMILAATPPASAQSPVAQSLAAQSPAAQDGVLWRPPSPIIGDHACMCRAAGVAYEAGERICLGERIAECTVEINVMNWRMTSEPCPEA